MKKFRKKPVVVEAEQWNKEGDVPEAGVVVKHDEKGKCAHCGLLMSVHGWVKTLEGEHIVCPGDWIIKGVKGEFYPCKEDIFCETYDMVV